MEKRVPLAHLLRPKVLADFVGQEHLVAEGKPLWKMIKSGELNSSIVLWGPPGCGKTTIARLMSHMTNSEFIEFSAVNSSKADIQKIVKRGSLSNKEKEGQLSLLSPNFQKNKKEIKGKRIVLFLDEIHRFNKAQQDFLLPYVEKGTITLIGATTENPSFEIISALLSRSRVFVFHRLSEEEIDKILSNGLKKERVFTKDRIILSDENRRLIARLSNGDARSAFNILELAISLSESSEIRKEDILDAVQKSPLAYDKNGEEHYNIISALHKSMRDSDADASVYWTMRMIEAGEDPKFIIRRMIRFASEDIGNADPNALNVAVAAKEAVEFLGYPECDTALVQTATYLACAPKSNAVYRAVGKARADIKKTGNLPVPMIMRNAPTQLMKDLGYGAGYKYVHDFKNLTKSESILKCPENLANLQKNSLSSLEEAREQQHLPDELEGEKYYEYGKTS